MKYKLMIAKRGKYYQGAVAIYENDKLLWVTKTGIVRPTKKDAILDAQRSYSDLILLNGVKK